MEGFAAPTLVDKLLELVLVAPSLSDAQKGKIGLALGRVDKCLVDGASDHLQVGLYVLVAGFERKGVHTFRGVRKYRVMHLPSLAYV
jgi:hypothetical protein